MKNIYLSMTLLATTMAFADDGAEETTQPKAVVEQTPFIEYNNRMAVFGPFHQVYERTKPDAFYTGVEMWLLPTYGREELLGEAELRMGYNFFYNGRDHLTPFAGLGLMEDFRSINGHKRRWSDLPTVLYGTVGFLYDHEFNRCFNLGSNFKLLIGGPIHHRHDWSSPVVGFDIAIPITFRCGYKRHWDFRIEPFDIYLHDKNISRNYLGFRSTVGYRF